MLKVASSLPKLEPSEQKIEPSPYPISLLPSTSTLPTELVPFHKKAKYLQRRLKRTEKEYIRKSVKLNHEL